MRAFRKPTMLAHRFLMMGLTLAALPGIGACLQTRELFGTPTDAGVVAEGGVEFDAGVVADADVVPDAGVVADAGVVPDARASEADAGGDADPCPPWPFVAMGGGTEACPDATP